MRFALVLGLAGALAAGAAQAEQHTGVAGGGAPIDNYQPSIVLNQVIARQGAFPCSQCGVAANSLGFIHTMASFVTPDAPAQGQIQSIAQNTALFSILGTTYGGNGQTTYALPDLAGRTIAGSFGGGDYTMGAEPGTPSNVMTIDQLAGHAHGLPGGGISGVTGLGLPMDNRQPGLAMNYMIAAEGFFQSSAVPNIGQVAAYAGVNTPGGWLKANGQLLSIEEYSALYAVLGTNYGGDGVDTFALPNLNGRVAVGAGGGLSLGQAFGSDNVTLPLALHDHALGGGFTDSAGGAASFDNAQASLAINYMIALQGVFPSSGSPFTDDSPFLGEVVGFGGSVAPNGWAFAQGQLLSIAQNQALFALLGTTYGGNGQTTFALPDLRGRTIMGAGGEFAVGEVFGQRNTTLSIANLAPHDHTVPDTRGAVPEPSAWALMLAGFGLAGAALRRRASRTAVI